MKPILGIMLGLLSTAAFAQSSTTTSSNGTGLQIGGMVQQTVGDRTVTIILGNGQPPKASNVKSTGPSNVSSGTSSAGLSIGAALGGGFGSTGGTAGTTAGAVPGF